jgi:hypothetical protein
VGRPGAEEFKKENRRSRRQEWDGGDSGEDGSGTWWEGLGRRLIWGSANRQRTDPERSGESMSTRTNASDQSNFVPLA